MPILGLKYFSIDLAPAVHPDLRSADVNLGFSVENHSLQPASDVEVGLAAWGLDVDESKLGGAPLFEDYLKLVEPGNEMAAYRLGLVRRFSVTKGGHRPYLGAFGRDCVSTQNPFMLPIRPVLNSVLKTEAAAYVVCANGLPTWFQVVLETVGEYQNGVWSMNLRRCEVLPAKGRPIVRISS
jgi:hypothetical protein